MMKRKTDAAPPALIPKAPVEALTAPALVEPLDLPRPLVEAPLAGVVEAPAPASSTFGRTVEEWCAEKSTVDWQFAAAKQLCGWPIGQRVSESDYDEAVEAASHVEIGAPTSGNEE